MSDFNDPFGFGAIQARVAERQEALGEDGWPDEEWGEGEGGPMDDPMPTEYRHIAAEREGFAIEGGGATDLPPLVEHPARTEPPSGYMAGLQDRAGSVPPLPPGTPSVSVSPPGYLNNLRGRADATGTPASARIATGEVERAVAEDLPEAPVATAPKAAVTLEDDRDLARHLFKEEDKDKNQAKGGGGGPVTLGGALMAWRAMSREDRIERIGAKRRSAALGQVAHAMEAMDTLGQGPSARRMAEMERTLHEAVRSVQEAGGNADRLREHFSRRLEGVQQRVAGQGAETGDPEHGELMRKIGESVARLIRNLLGRQEPTDHEGDAPAPGH